MSATLYTILPPRSCPPPAAPHPSPLAISVKIRTIALLFFTSDVAFPGFLPLSFPAVLNPQGLESRVGMSSGVPWRATGKTATEPQAGDGVGLQGESAQRLLVITNELSGGEPVSSGPFVFPGCPLLT